MPNNNSSSRQILPAMIEQLSDTIEPLLDSALDVLERALSARRVIASRNAIGGFAPGGLSDHATALTSVELLIR